MTSTSVTRVQSGRYSAKQQTTSREVLREYIHTFAHDFAPITRVSEIPGSMTYTELPDALKKRATHIGQIKLFLSEVQFLSLPETSQCDIVVYAGSAPGHTRQVLADMFPRIRTFILVDPNEHYIMGSHRGDNCVYLRISDNATRSFVPYGNNIRFLFKDGTEARGSKIDYPPSTSRVTSSGEPCATADEMIDTIVAHMSSTTATATTRFYIIEDIFTTDLARAIARAFDSTQRIAFISDIRTRSANEEHPNDADVVVNNMMQQLWVSDMQPRAIMLKFRTPFFNDDARETIARISLPENASICAQYYERFSTTLDQVYNAPSRVYRYLANDGLYLQAFAGQSSSETRLVVTRATSNNYARLTDYDVRMYEDAMFYYNRMREYATTARHKSKWRLIDGLDGCPDCDLMMRILGGATQIPLQMLHNVLAISHRTLKQDGHGSAFNVSSH